MSLSVETVQCPQCGSGISAEAQFCPMCGRNAEEGDAAISSGPPTSFPEHAAAFQTPMDPGPFRTPMPPVDFTGEAAVEEQAEPVVTPPRPQPPAPPLTAPAPQEAEVDAWPSEPRRVPVKAYRGDSRRLGDEQREEAPAERERALVAVTQAVYNLGQSQRQSNQAAPQNPRYQQLQQMQQAWQQPAQSGPPADYNYTYSRPEYAPRPRRIDPAVAQRRELWAYVGFLGAGHIYAGHPARGLVLMVAWWVFLPWAITNALIGQGSSCFWFTLALVAPILSGAWIRFELRPT